MKGISFQNGVEFKLTINGESWPQAVPIEGQLEATVKNPGAALGKLRVVLAETTHRKLKNKSPGAFEVIEEASSEKSPLFWNFTLPIQARITDNPGSLFVLYGNQEDLHTLGILKINITPHPYLVDLVDLMRTEFRFALKNQTAGKNGFVDAKLEPSGSKEWAGLEELILASQVTEDTIEAKFIFNQTKLQKREVSRSWPIHEMVHDFNNRLNKDAATLAIQDVISEYRSAGWLA